MIEVVTSRPSHSRFPTSLPTSPLHSSCVSTIPSDSSLSASNAPHTLPERFSHAFDSAESSTSLSNYICFQIGHEHVHTLRQISQQKFSPLTPEQRKVHLKMHICAVMSHLT